MTTKQKCARFAKVLDTISLKLKEDIGVQLWEQEEITMQSLVAQAQLILKKVDDMTSNELPSTAKIRKKIKERKENSKTEDKLVNDWPDILL